MHKPTIHISKSTCAVTGCAIPPAVLIPFIYEGLVIFCGVLILLKNSFFIAPNPLPVSIIAGAHFPQFLLVLDFCPLVQPFKHRF